MLDLDFEIVKLVVLIVGCLEALLQSGWSVLIGNELDSSVTSWMLFVV